MAVGSHIAEFASALHHHHVTEDERLWDTLESRSPACALHISQMKSQHAVVVALLDKLDAQLSQWQESADPPAGEAVAGILDEVNAKLALHFGEEEDKMLPVASMTMSQHEWNKFQDLGRASVPKNRLMVQLGYILGPLAPEERTAWMKEGLPGFVRLLYRLVGRRQYEADYRRVYGTVPG